MIIYGTGEKKLSTRQQFMKARCPECGEQAIGFHFFKKYIHIFWIPFFPYSTRSVAFCEKCQASYQESIPTALKFDMDHARNTASTPLTLFAGSALLVIGVAVSVYLDGGTTTHYYPSKAPQSMGRYVNDRQEGKWTYWYENGAVQSEQFYKNGAEDSVWTWYNEQGAKTKVGSYRNGVYHGKWIFFYPSGAVQEESMFSDNRQHGLSVAYFENGQKAAEGNYARDRQDGYWTFWYDNGNKMMEGNFIAGTSTGEWKYYFVSGKLNSETVYKDSIEYIMTVYDEASRLLVEDGNGVSVTRYETGQKASEGNIRNGLRHGRWTLWYPNGALQETGKYDNGDYQLENSWDPDGQVMVRGGNGYHKSFYENGVVSSEGLFRNGRPHGLFYTRTMENILISEVNYAEGVMSGEAKQYHPTGELESEGLFENNVMTGIFTWYHLNGSKQCQVNFVSGKKEGEQTFWSESGEVVKREFYENGELIGEAVGN